MEEEVKAIALQERCDAVHSAVRLMLRSENRYNEEDYGYVALVYEDYCIVRMPKGGMMKAEYTLAPGGVATIQPRTEWVSVEKEWVTVGENTDVRTAGGRVGIKSVTKDTAIIAGYGVVFGGIDLYGDTFTEETDFKYSNPNPPLFYDHTMTGVEEDLGVVVKTKKDKFGIWMESQIDLHKNYAKQVLSLAEKGVLGYSTGAISHLVRREGNTIKSWAIGELSLTPTPAEPRTVGVGVVKSATEAIAEAATQTITEGAATGSIEVIDNKEGHMSDETERVAALETKFDAFSARIDAVLKMAEDSPAIRKAGIVSETGGTSDPARKSFADFLVAVKRHDSKRLNSVYHTHDRPLDEGDEMKAMSSNVGSDGGFLVPEEYMAQLMQVAGDNAIVRPRATVIPVKAPSGTFPALDQRTVTGGTGDTAYAGGVIASWGEESATLTETDPNFQLINWRVHKLQGYTKVPNELLADSAISIETLLKRLFGVAIASKEDYAFLRGDGVGKPLGMLMSPAALGIDADTNDTWDQDDAVEMLSRFRAVNDAAAVWVGHRSILPDLGRFELSAGSPATWLASFQQKVPGNLLGYPLLWSQHMAQTNNPYDVALVDPSAYLILDREDLRIDFSEHAGFLTDQGVWRFTKRVDGRPWVTGTVELADETGNYTVSPFVYNND